MTLARWATSGARRVSSGDGKAVLVLIGIPLVVFVVPALAGHPAIAGDNTIQNLPLRVLTGRILRAGHLPLWNPYIWSGSPLLPALNAGSAYPFTWLFVVLPPVAAWVVNLLVAYWVGGLGCYALARSYRLAPLASLLGAATFAFSGAMAAQMVHLPIVQGWSWMPLAVLAELRLARAVLGDGASGSGSPWPWTVLLATTLGLILLTGEPRGMAEAQIVASVVALWVVLRPYRDRPQGPPGVRARLRLSGHLLFGALWAAALSGVELLPGWAFISGSQRAAESLSFFGSGSLEPVWSVLLLVPNLFGGDGFLNQPSFFNSYNLPEVTGYVGLLPLVAAAALLTVSFGRARVRRSADWGLWLALFGLGLLLSWGTYTPFGTVIFGHIPLFDLLRLQSRNLGIVDLALGMLLAFWLHEAWGADPGRAGLDARRRWIAAAPALAAGALCVVALAIPGPLETAFGVAPALSYLGRYLTPWFIASLLVAVAVVALVLAWRRLGPTARRRGVCVLVFVDVVLFSATSSTGLASGNIQVQPSRRTAVGVLGDRGRFAIFDTTATNIDVLSGAGQPDLNVYTRLPSVQGYGSLTAGYYEDVTGTHTLDTLDPCALARGQFRQVRLATLLTLPVSLIRSVPRTGAPPAPPPACPGAPPAGTAHLRTWYLGTTLSVIAATLLPAARYARAFAHQAPRVGVVAGTGAVLWPPEAVRRAGGAWSVRFGAPQRAVGLVVAGPSRAVSETSQVTSSGGRRYVLDGVLQQALGQAGWRYTGTWHHYARFQTRRVRPPVWTDGAAPGTSVRQLRTTEWGEEVDRVVSARRVLVVRSEAASPGWSVRAVPVGGGTARVLPVERVGLVQGVWVPAGAWTLTFTYWAPRLDAGAAASGAALAGLAVMGTLWRWRRRRRRARSEAPRAPAEHVADTVAAPLARR